MYRKVRKFIEGKPNQKKTVHANAEDKIRKNNHQFFPAIGPPFLCCVVCFINFFLLCLSNALTYINVSTGRAIFAVNIIILSGQTGRSDLYFIYAENWIRKGGRERVDWERRVPKKNGCITKATNNNNKTVDSAV